MIIDYTNPLLCYWQPLEYHTMPPQSCKCGKTETNWSVHLFKNFKMMLVRLQASHRLAGTPTCHHATLA